MGGSIFIGDMGQLYTGANKRGKLTFTLKKICNIIGADLPVEYRRHANVTLSEVGYNTMSMKALNGEISSICFDVWPQANTRKRFAEYIEGGGMLYQQ